MSDDEKRLKQCGIGEHGPSAGIVFAGELRLEVCPSTACRAAASRVLHERSGKPAAYRSHRVAA